MFWWRIPKVFINYVWTVFLKKQRVMRHVFFCFDRCEMKNLHLLLLFFAGDSCLLSLCMLVWNKFSLRTRTFRCAFDFLNLCTVKQRSLWFAFRHKHTGAHGGSRGSRPLPFFYIVKTVPSTLTKLKQTLWKISLKNKRIHQSNVPTAFSWSFSTLL